jgi:hypothetical protein
MVPLCPSRPTPLRRRRCRKAIRRLLLPAPIIIIIIVVVALRRIAAAARSTTAALSSDAVICLYDYTPSATRSSRFVATISLLFCARKESGWWLGSLRGAVGKFPRNLTKIITKDDSEDSDEVRDDDEDNEALELMFQRLKFAKSGQSLVDLDTVAATAASTAASASIDFAS